MGGEQLIAVTIREAEADLSGLIRKAGDGKEVVIFSGSKPTARLVAMGDVIISRRPGSWKGRLHVGPEFFEPLPTGEF